MENFSVPAFAVSLLILLATPCMAAVTVVGEGAESITVEIEEAPVASVLENLRDRFGFELDGSEKAAGGEALTLTLTGSLKDVLGRLLRNWNYVIVSSADGGEGVAKVVILNAAYGAAPSTPIKAESKDENMKQVTGEE
jgi:hypothetical protein